MKRKIPIYSKLTTVLLLFTLYILTSCSKYLDAKPDKSLLVPQTVEDLQRLLDNNLMVVQYPVAAEAGSDNYYLTSSDWSALTSLDERNYYTWDREALDEEDWRFAYERIVYANVVLDQLPKVDLNAGTQAARDNVKGSALFFRAFNFYELAQIYAVPYSSANEQKKFGLPLRITPDINAPTIRSTVGETYDRIIRDLKEAESLLPEKITYRIRPSKPAVHTLLARTYLTMGKYDSCSKYASLALQSYNTLVDFNTLSSSATVPFGLYFNEVIFHSTIRSSRILNPPVCRVDSSLYNSYTNNDLRKTLFYKNNNNGSFSFKGNYYVVATSLLFNGLAASELYLMRAECQARAGNITDALKDINTLLLKRWKTSTYIPPVITTADSMLSFILHERRKELAFRPGLRWSDLRRLNVEGTFEITLSRELNGKTFVLKPNDPRYTLLIPTSVVRLSGIEQNER